MPKPVKTDQLYYWKDCPVCNGTGKRGTSLPGWYIEYRYQDCHEIGGPFRQKEALRRMESRDPSCMKTLIGPDGAVYILEPDAPPTHPCL